MKNKKILLGAFLILFIAISFASSLEAKMIKEVAIGLFTNAPSLDDGTKFYLRYHGPEVVRNSAPWMTRYQSWLPYVPPEDAVKLFGAVRGRYAELWYHEEDYLERPDLSENTYPDWDDGSGPSRDQTTLMVSAVPEVFYSMGAHPEKTTILRWVTLIAYPEGVSEEEGEKWFKEVHVKEAEKQEGIFKIVSYKAVSLGNHGGGDAPPSGDMPGMPPQSGDMPQMSGEMPKMRSWVRVVEYWYKDFAAWRKAVIESPPKYTAPSWGGKYPFVEMTSTFIPYYPDIDFLKGTYTPDANLPLAD